MSTKYKAGCGIHIDAACQEAVAFAQRAGEPQSFDFNGITVVANADSNPAELSAKWSADIEAERVAYQNSAEGKKQAAERQAAITTKQGTHDSLVADLPRVLSERRDSLMRWLRDFAEVADDIGVKKDFAPVMSQLEGAGYSVNEATGLDKSEYEKPAIMAAYIVGQAMACMKGGMPPHPVTGSFVEKYFALNTPTS